MGGVYNLKMFNCTLGRDGRDGPANVESKLYTLILYPCLSVIENIEHTPLVWGVGFCVQAGEEVYLGSTCAPQMA